MRAKRHIPGKAVFDRLAAENGVAIAVVDRSGVETSSSNNNSICETLNPDGLLSPSCSADCGKALERSVEAGTTIQFTCHAGLECRAAEMNNDSHPVAVIIGRTFVRSENYRRATERAVNGDWKRYSPADLFANVLLTGSSGVLDTAAEQFMNEAPIIADPEPVKESPRQQRQADTDVGSQAPAPASRASSLPSVGGSAANAWRSFFDSLLQQDHASARDSIMRFVAERYCLSPVVWLERRGDSFVKTAVLGDVRARKISVSLKRDDPRLRSALESDMPVELGEARSEARRMFLFPIPVGDDVNSALAVLGSIADDRVKHHLARMCAAIAPRLEILRLRGKVERTSVARRFTESIGRAGSDDLWQDLIAAVANILGAERGSLITGSDDEGRELAVRAAVGSTFDLRTEPHAGSRVARLVLERKKPIIVDDVRSTGLAPVDTERRYRTPSFMSVPIPIDGRRSAVLSFTDKAGDGKFDVDDLEVIRTITPQLVMAIDRAFLNDRARQFEQMSVTDAVTGLLNRRYIEERLSEEVKRSVRHGYPMCLIMLDVDNFKSYNDSFGHTAGDIALKRVADIVRGTLRGADVATRWGGEEFCVLLPQTTGEEGSAIAERLRRNVASAEFPHRSVTVSLGLAACSSELCSHLDMVDAADAALYAAKARGRDRVVEFSALTQEELGRYRDRKK